MRDLSRPELSIDDQFGISTNDLNEDGLAVMKLAYDKWLTKVDRGMPPGDLTLIEIALKKVRGS